MGIFFCTENSFSKYIYICNCNYKFMSGVCCVPFGYTISVAKNRPSVIPSTIY